MLYLCIERGRGNPEGVRESMGGPHCLFLGFFVPFKIITYWSREFSPPPLARKGGDGQVPKGQVCGGGLGRSQGIVHITWDGKQSNILVLLGNSASPIIRKLLCFLPSHRKYFQRQYLPPQEITYCVLENGLARGLLYLPTCWAALEKGEKPPGLKEASKRMPA